MSFLTNITQAMRLATYQLTFEIDDNDPLIQYNPPDAWTQSNSSSDTFISKYYGETLTQASVVGAQAVFAFNGTGMTIFGGKRKDYGPFTVVLDDVQYPESAYADDEEAAVALFSKNDLPNSKHTVTIINTGLSPFDIDKIAWTTEVNPQHGRAPLETITVDDTDPAFKWMPPTAWNAQPSGLDQFNEQTGHSTSLAGASVTYTFTGEIISIFGTVGPHNAPYTVQLDNWSLMYLNATTTFWTPKALLFFADNLGPGNHTITLYNAQPQASGLVMEVDYAEVRRFMPTALTSPSSSPSADQSNMMQGGKQMNALIILSVIFGTIVVSVLLWTFWYLWRRNRELYARLEEECKVDNQFDWALPSNSIETLSMSSSGHTITTTTSHQTSRSQKGGLPLYGYQRSTTNTSQESLPLTRSYSLRSDSSTSDSRDESHHGANPSGRQALRPLRLPLKLLGGGRSYQTTPDMDRSARFVDHNGRPPLSDRIDETDESETMEDFGHVPVEGEPAPPDYWQATAPYHLRRS